MTDTLRAVPGFPDVDVSPGAKPLRDGMNIIRADELKPGDVVTADTTMAYGPRTRPQFGPLRRPFRVAAVSVREGGWRGLDLYVEADEDGFGLPFEPDGICMASGWPVLVAR